MSEINEALADVTAIRKGGYLTLHFGGLAYTQAKKFVELWKSRGEKEKVRVSIAIERPHRSLSQLALHWSLIRILTFETSGTFDKMDQEITHEGMLEERAERFGDWLVLPKTERKIARRTGMMDSKQMSQLIEADFDMLVANGVSVENSGQCARYWTEWMRWRGKQKVDPVTYASLKDYDARVNWCEACLCRVEPGEGQLAHIVGAGAGGDTIAVGDEAQRVKNRVKLCTYHHLWLDHQKGDEELLHEFPHLAWRWNQAREMFGLPPVKVERKKAWQGKVTI
jgi:hypothetical protein